MRVQFVRPAAAVGTVLLGLVLAGCGGNKVTFSPVSGATARPTDAATASPTGGGEAEGKVVFGSGDARLTLTIDTSVARSPEEADAADVYRRYYELRVRGANDGKVDVAALSKVSSGAAAREAIRSRAGETRLVGDLALNLSSVDVDGDSAQIVTCVSAQARKVDQAGNVVEESVPGGQWHSDLQRFGPSWKVVTAVQDPGGGACT
jgi:hypothetical protein